MIGLIDSFDWFAWIQLIVVDIAGIYPDFNVRLTAFIIQNSNIHFIHHPLHQPRSPRQQFLHHALFDLAGFAQLLF